MASKKKNPRLLAEVDAAKGKAVGINAPDVDTLEKLHGFGEKFPTKRWQSYLELQRAGMDVNQLLKEQLAQHEAKPKAHEDMAKISEETFQQIIAVLEVFRIREDLRHYLNLDLFQELVAKIAELQAELKKQ